MHLADGPLWMPLIVAGCGLVLLALSIPEGPPRVAQCARIVPAAPRQKQPRARRGWFRQQVRAC
jgi:hypothetical protein